MTLATFAAFAAAAVSLINVVVTSRLTRRGQREQWRRDTERPIVANLLATSKECLETWADAASHMEPLTAAQRAGEGLTSETKDALIKAIQKWADAWVLVEKLNVISSELDLVASAGLRHAVNDLVDRHAAIRREANPGEASPSGIVERYGHEIADLRERVIAATRADIGVDTGSLGARWRGRIALWSSGKAE